MMRAITVTFTIGAVLTLSACANDSMLGLTETSPPSATAALPPKPRFDPACNTLAARIDALRKDGVVDRVEAAAKGKGSTVNVKRASLGQIADLEKANAEFQSKCSTVPRVAAAPAPVVTAPVVAPALQQVAAAAKAPAAKAAAVAKAATKTKAEPAPKQ